MEQKSIHSGHRMRIKERYLSSGFDDFSIHEVLEMILFYGIPRKDTNELAHRLIDHYGSISAVMDASVEDLIENGVTENAAVLLNLIPLLGREYVGDKTIDNDRLYNNRILKNKIRSALTGQCSDNTLVILYDTRGFELFFGFFDREYPFGSNELISKITELSMKYHALSAIIARIKDNGIAYPSKEDIDSIVRIITILTRVGVKLTDFFIFADRNLYSMSQDKDYIDLLGQPRTIYRKI